MAAEASPNKKLGPQGKWAALVKSNVLHKLHRLPELTEEQVQMLTTSSSSSSRHPLPLSVHSAKIKESSTPLLKTYSGSAQPTWPTFTGTSLTKLLGDQVVLNSCSNFDKVSKS